MLQRTKTSTTSGIRVKVRKPRFLFRAILALSLSSGFALLPSPPGAFAHGGGLDGNGGHNCRVGSCAGTYHCHRCPCGCEVSSQTPASGEIIISPQLLEAIQALEEFKKSKETVIPALSIPNSVNPVIAENLKGVEDFLRDGSQSGGTSSKTGLPNNSLSPAGYSSKDNESESDSPPDAKAFLLALLIVGSPFIYGFYWSRKK